MKFKIGDKVRTKSLDEILIIEGVEHYNHVGAPWITSYMLEHFGREGMITAFNEYEYCLVLFNEGEWKFKKEWLEEIDTTRAEETVASLEKDSHLYYKIKNEEGAVLGAYKVEYEPTKRIINPSYDDLKPLFIKTDSDKHVEGVVEMKTSEFIEKVQELGYEVVDDVNRIRVFRNNNVVAVVFNSRINVLDTNYYESASDELFNILINYASTPIEKRKDKQRYYLYNPIKKSYFHYDVELDDYGWLSQLHRPSDSMTVIHNQFTEDEIKNHKFRDIMELLVKKEKVE